MISYDIEEDRYRSRISKYLHEEGFVRIQYSVYAGSGDYRRLNQIKTRIKDKLSNSRGRYSIFYTSIDLATFQEDYQGYVPILFYLTHRIEQVYF